MQRTRTPPRRRKQFFSDDDVVATRKSKSIVVVEPETPAELSTIEFKAETLPDESDAIDDNAGDDGDDDAAATIEDAETNAESEMLPQTNDESSMPTTSAARKMPRRAARVLDEQLLQVLDASEMPAVYSFFDRVGIDDRHSIRADCNECDRVVFGHGADQRRTSNFIRHLRVRHPDKHALFRERSSQVSGMSGFYVFYFILKYFVSPKVKFLEGS